MKSCIAAAVLSSLVAGISGLEVPPAQPPPAPPSLPPHAVVGEIAALFASGAAASLLATILLVYQPVVYVLFGVSITVFAVATNQFYASKLLVMYSWLAMQLLCSGYLSGRVRAFKLGFALLWPIQFLVFPSLAPDGIPALAVGMVWYSSCVMAAVPVSLLWHDGGLQPLHADGQRWRNWHYPNEWLTLDFEVLYNLWFCSFWCLKGEYGVLMFLAFQSCYYLCERLIVVLTNFSGDAATLWPSVRIASATFYLILPPVGALSEPPLYNASVGCNLLFISYQAYLTVRWLRRVLLKCLGPRDKTRILGRSDSACTKSASASWPSESSHHVSDTSTESI